METSIVNDDRETVLSLLFAINTIAQGNGIFITKTTWWWDRLMGIPMSVLQRLDIEMMQDTHYVYVRGGKPVELLIFINAIIRLFCSPTIGHCYDEACRYYLGTSCKVSSPHGDDMSRKRAPFYWHLYKEFINRFVSQNTRLPAIWSFVLVLAWIIVEQVELLVIRNAWCSYDVPAIPIHPGRIRKDAMFYYLYQPVTCYQV